MRQIKITQPEEKLDPGTLYRSSPDLYARPYPSPWSSVDISSTLFLKGLLDRQGRGYFLPTGPTTEADGFLAFWILGLIFSQKWQ